MDAGGDPYSYPIDDGSESEDGQDAGFDAGDDGAAAEADEGGDLGPCGGECNPPETCREISGAACCLPDCTVGKLCEQIPCVAETAVCRLSPGETPIPEWAVLDQGGPHRCLLAGGPGPLPQTRCLDDRYLLFNCTQDGMCYDGACVPDPTVERTHDCLANFGCEGDAASGWCRSFMANGAPCLYNYDCQSYCCDRTAQSACVPFRLEDCKLFRSFYREVFTQYIWTAFSQSDPHDLDTWSWDHGVPEESCDQDHQCDSGRCGGFGEALKCALPDCLADTEAHTIRANYFCGTGDHDAHMQSVVNPDPFPASDRCD
jgi:hypothetical protein